MSFLKEKNHIKGPNHFFGNRSRWFENGAFIFVRYRAPIKN
jgi:hypothetical protein